LRIFVGVYEVIKSNYSHFHVTLEKCVILGTVLSALMWYLFVGLEGVGMGIVFGVLCGAGYGRMVPTN
jgi:hypothetical protein